MHSLLLGATAIRECERCLGLWVEVPAFEKICADREQQAAVLGAASPAPTKPIRGVNKVRYVPCPECEQLMNRINFARCSGVVVDICKGHGTWFDREELSRMSSLFAEVVSTRLDQKKSGARGRTPPSRIIETSEHSGSLIGIAEKMMIGTR